MMLEELDDSTRWYVNSVPEEMLMENDQIGMTKIVNTGIPTGIGSAPPGIDGFMMLEDLDDTARWYVNGVPEEILMENDQISLTKLVNTSTQTGISNAPPGSRKIKPVKHPGLKLQTPIAYQRDTDLNVIPIQKEGRAVCKKCGAIGVKHAFYTRERRFCSLACARGAAEEGIEMNDINEETDCSEPSADKMVVYSQPSMVESQLPPVFILQQDEPVPVPESTFSFDWTPHLSDPYFCAAPVSCFPHAPMSDIRDYIDVGLKVEVENRDNHDLGDDLPHSSSIATVLRVEGYKALLRYEGYGDDESKDFWVNVCSPSIHPVGWCAIRGKPLIPPHEIKHKYSNWKEFLRKRLTGARTLPSNFNSKVQDSLKSRFRCDLTVEVVDKNRVSQVKVAKIVKIIGKRLKLRYYDTKSHSNDAEFWCHEDSPLIHPVGWAKSVGQKLNAPPEYHDRVSKGLREKDDATPDLFALPERQAFPNYCFFQEGMKLEAIDPLNLSDICVATVMQVLNDGYLMISVDFWNDQHPTSEDWFCYHMTSPCIFPAGFCASNNIPLTPPKDYNKDTFDWNRYLLETGCMAAPPTLFNQEIPDHGFQVGMKIEAADLMNPRLVCVATIGKVVGRLLKLQFDGWGNDYDQWVDCLSCDLYPVGWCELVQHKLEPPFSEAKSAMESSKMVEVAMPPVLTEQIHNCVEEKQKVIPRLSDIKVRTSPTTISPETWDVSDVAEFLKVNDCSQYCDAFVKQGINGKKLIQLTKEEVHALVAKKVGPALKIQNLIDQLTSKVNPSTHSPRLKTSKSTS